MLTVNENLGIGVALIHEVLSSRARRTGDGEAVVGERLDGHSWMACGSANPEVQCIPCDAAGLYGCARPDVEASTTTHK